MYAFAYFGLSLKLYDFFNFGLIVKIVVPTILLDIFLFLLLGPLDPLAKN